ncbi:ABC transporter permease [Actinokineospora auranticolor]|uniref:ABC-2 type transport system permease protein n=1 Tax=Actinokineospora auranticolor TaxID=155976 RepID=A0A2S6GJ09_9PSEU|nr:ABC transporter permease [Actinokineospora auranticolor]PPK65173.1 ABC-2 type transport system permease protein [Actinokineospora auranticolor]
MTVPEGTWVLARLALRRDRVLLPAWMAALALVAITSAAATKGLYPTADSVRQAAGALNDTPAMVAVYGHIADVSSLGALAMLKPLTTGAVLVAVLAAMLVVRHTRAEEEAGRLELVRAGLVDRFAPMTAALVVVIGANAVMAVVTALGLSATGLPVAGSCTLAAAWLFVAAVFAGVGALAAQVVTGARAANGLAVSALGAAFAVRAIGDTTAPWLSWLSPLGWAQRTRPFAGDHWWVACVGLVVAGALMAAAYGVLARRDLGAGVLPERVGPATAGRGLRSALGLAWRLQRGSLLAWSAGFAAYGLLVGGVADQVGGLLDSDQARELFTRLGGQSGMTDAVLAAMVGLLGVVASAYGVQAALRPAVEEDAGRAALLLSTPLGRPRWVAGHLLIAGTGVVVVLAAAGVAAGAVHGARTGDAGQIGRVLTAALAQAPAGWLLTGLVLAVFGVAPRFAKATWAALAVFLLLGELGPALGLADWLIGLSPYAHLPHLPGGAFAPLPVASLVAASAVLVAGGLTAFRHRDVG